MVREMVASSQAWLTEQRDGGSGVPPEIRADRKPVSDVVLEIEQRVRCGLEFGWRRAAAGVNNSVPQTHEVTQVDASRRRSSWVPPSAQAGPERA